MAQDNNVAAIIQLLIDHPKLDRYFHVDVKPERKPLVVSLAGAAAPPLAQLKKFGMPVKSLGAEKSTGPVLSITLRTAEAGQTRVDFAYDVEGIAGHALFSEQNGRPVLRDISISER